MRRSASARWPIAVVLATLLPMAAAFSAPAADFSFSGTLEYLAPTQLTLRLADGRLVDALLAEGTSPAAGNLAAEHAIGDSVEVDYAQIKPTYDPSRTAFRMLQVAAVRAKGKTSSLELTEILASRDWREAGNLLHLPSGAIPPAAAAADHPDAFLDQSRAAVLAYVSDLPNFTVRESTSRDQAVDGSDQTSTIASQKSHNA